MDTSDWLLLPLRLWNVLLAFAYIIIPAAILLAGAARYYLSSPQKRAALDAQAEKELAARAERQRQTPK